MVTHARMSVQPAEQTALFKVVLAYLFVGGVVSMVGLGSTGLVSMEGMVVDGAQHMVETGDFVVPHVYDEIYTYKPPLCYWLAMTGLGSSGMGTPFWIRLPFACTGLLLGLVTLLFVAKLLGTHLGLAAGLASLTSGLFLQKLRIAEYDVPLAAGVGIAVVAASWNFVRERDHLGVWLLAYLGLSMGFLAKGAPALMSFIPGLVLAAALTGRISRLLRRPHLTGLLAFFLLAGSSVLLAVRSGGMTVFDQPLLEARDRGFGWTIGDVGTSLFRPVAVFAVFLPWSLAIPFCFFGRTNKTRKQPEERLLRCATAFVLTGILAFSIVPKIEPRYFLPLAAGVGIMAAIGAQAEAGLRPAAERLRRNGSIAVALLSASACVILGFVLESSRVELSNRVTLGAIGLGLIAAWTVILRYRPREHVALWLLVASLGVWNIESFGLQPRRASKRVLEPVAERLAPHISPDDRVWVLGPASTAGKNASLYYYLDRPVRAFRLEGELPPPGSLMVLTPDHLERLRHRGDFGSTAIERVEHVYATFLLERLDG